MKGTGAKRNVCPGTCVSTGAKFPVAPVESAPMLARVPNLGRQNRGSRVIGSSPTFGAGQQCTPGSLSM